MTAPLSPPLMYPAVGQGAIGIECRSDDIELQSLLAKINDPNTFASVTAERSLLSTLRAGCHAPLGVLTEIEGKSLHLESVLLTTDGTKRWTASASAPMTDPISLGKTVAQSLFDQGASIAIDG
jgi:hydroxymethylbilane synthase